LLEVEQILGLGLLPAAPPKVATLTPFSAALALFVALRLGFCA